MKSKYQQQHNESHKTEILEGIHQKEQRNGFPSNPNYYIEDIEDIETKVLTRKMQQTNSKAIGTFMAKMYTYYFYSSTHNPNLRNKKL